MKKAIYLPGIISVIAIAVITLACAAATADFTVTSSTDANHNHHVVISGKDVDSPPTADKTITSDGTSHTHTIVLTKQNFEAIKAGQEVTVTSSSSGTPAHSHTFKIKKP